jgi:hypothetical protein
LKKKSKLKNHQIQVWEGGGKKIRIKESLGDYLKELLGFMRELTENQLFIGWLFKATAPTCTPSTGCLLLLVVDEPQPS